MSFSKRGSTGRNPAQHQAPWVVYRRLGQSQPLHAHEAEAAALVVLAGYAPHTAPVGAPVAVAAGPMAALWPRVRHGWVFDPRAQRPSPARRPATGGGYR